MSVVHTRPSKDAWATCGAEGPDVVFGDVPTCVFCAMNAWAADDHELTRILARNSVKDIQETEDLRMYQGIMMSMGFNSRSR